MNHTWPNILTGLVSGVNLDRAASAWAMNEILAGHASPVQIAGFVVALRTKGETVDEISGLSEGMLDHATPIDLDNNAVDIVGSGGDRANTVNVSTMAAIVAAAAGARVIKHGNRAASSACGTADCLEALGLTLAVPPQAQQRILDEVGIVFLFAAYYHQSLRHAAATRRELGISTTFNFLGPLSNPARPAAQAIGIANSRMAHLVAGVLTARGNQGLVFHGADGLDELTTTTTSDVYLFADGRQVFTTFDPNVLGLRPASKLDLIGGKPAVNAQIVRETLAGKPGAVRDIVLLNTAAALLAFDKPDLDTDLAEQLAPRLDRARVAIDSGAAAELLDAWVALTQQAAGA